MGGVKQPAETMVVGSASERVRLYRKVHHYSQSITGAPGSFTPNLTPNLLKKPETSLGSGMATAISKYKKFMLTNSGDSSLKQSPRVINSH